MLLNMDGYDDDISSPRSQAIGMPSAGSASSAFSASDIVHSTASYHDGRSQFCGDSRPQWPEDNMYPYDFQDYPRYSTTTDTPEHPGSGHSHQTSSDPGGRSSTLARPIARSREDNPWQMYLSASLPDSLHSFDLDIPDPHSLDLVYSQQPRELAEFSELDELSSYQLEDAQTVNDIQIFRNTPLVAPRHRNIQPSLLSLSLMSTQENPLLLADEPTVYPSDISAPKFDACTAESAPSSPPLSLSRGRSPTITKLVNHPSTRPRRGLVGWGSTNFHLEPSITPSSSPGSRPKKLPSRSISPLKSSYLTVQESQRLSPPLSSSTGGSSRNPERLLKRLRQSDESPPPTLKRASKGRRLMVAADVETEDDGAGNKGGDSDSDDYTPSRSPSLNLSRSNSPSLVFQSYTGVGSTPAKKNTQKGKGKAKGSAALALAVVSQMVRDPSGDRRDSDLRYVNGVARRKNHPIPLPIPVPNLNKKSRGRKVPYIAATDSSDRVSKRKSAEVVKKEEEEEDINANNKSGEDQSRSRSSTSGRSRRKPITTPEMSKTPSGENRTFVCLASGCGKCFVRSEHLKRHVRSIHTHDKREFSLFSVL